MSSSSSHIFVAIDIGSNAIKIKSWRLLPDAEPEQLDFSRYPIRLGASVFLKGDLDGDVIAKLIELFQKVRREYEAQGETSFQAVATSAMREAGNREMVRERLREASGIDVRIVDGETEARLMALSVLGRHAAPNHSHLLLDIGGGSTEIIRTRGVDVLEARSLPIGAVRLRGRCWPESDPPSPEQAEAGRGFVVKLLNDAQLSTHEASATDVVGLAGTITTLHRMMVHCGMDTQPAEQGEQPRMTVEQIEQLSREIASLPARQIAQQYAIEPDRAEVIFAGSLILIELMQQLGVQCLRVRSGGVSDGLLEEHLARNPANAETARETH